MLRELGHAPPPSTISQGGRTDKQGGQWCPHTAAGQCSNGAAVHSGESERLLEEGVSEQGVGDE